MRTRCWMMIYELYIMGSEEGKGIWDLHRAFCVELCMMDLRSGEKKG